jgi:hypothetical protein
VFCDISSPSIDILDYDNLKIWQTSTAPFIQVATYSSTQPPILNGNYQLHEEIVSKSLTQSQTIDCESIVSNETSLLIPGTISAQYDNVSRFYNYTLQFSTIPNSNILSFDINIIENNEILTGGNSSSSSFNMITLSKIFYEVLSFTMNFLVIQFFARIF